MTRLPPRANEASEPSDPHAGADEAADLRALLAAIVESSDDAIVSKTLDGFISSWNPAAVRMFGYTPSEVIGKSVLVIIPPELHYQEAVILSKIRTGERIVHFETTRVAKDGHHIDVSLTVSPVKNAAGRIIGVSKVARDITERKRTEMRLQDAARRKDEFLAMLGHELRNPLAPIQHLVEVLRRTGGGGDKQADILAALDRQVIHMKKLLDDLLDVSRITLGKIQFERSPLNIVTALEQAAEMNRPLIDERRHRLHLDLPSPAPLMLGDFTRLVQAFGNLLNNAAKYTPEGGDIRVVMTADERAVRVRIADTGAGITSDLLPLVFDIFVQADRTFERSQGGLGLGLALVRKIVEQHGGTVEAISRGSQMGSEFVVTLPISNDAEALESEAPSESRTGSTQARRVVVVDDNNDSRRALSMLLQLTGHIVFDFGDGPSALDAVERLQPDFVLLDIGLPGMNGYDVARNMRQRGCKATLVAVTGYGQTEDQRLSTEAGFQHHLVKPVSPSVLYELLA